MAFEKAEHHHRMTPKEKRQTHSCRTKNTWAILFEGDKELHKQLKVTSKIPQKKVRRFSGNCKNIAIENFGKNRWRSINHTAWCLCPLLYCTKLQFSIVCPQRNVFRDNFSRLSSFLSSFFMNDTETFLFVMHSSFCLPLLTIPSAHSNKVSCLFFNTIFCPRHKGDESVSFADKYFGCYCCPS